MSRKSMGLGLVTLLGVGLGLGYTGWKIHSSAAAQYCEFSGRPVHPLSKTVGRVNGERKVFCCLTCAFTQQVQTGKAVQVLELTDFETGNSLAPQDAYVVEGSNLNFCLRPQMLRDQSKQASPMDFDRCSPSILAFARREAAEAFRSEHGGTLAPFEELAAAHSP